MVVPHVRLVHSMRRTTLVGLRRRRKPHVPTHKKGKVLWNESNRTGPAQVIDSIYRHRTATNISVLGPPATHHVESKARRHGCLSYHRPPY